MYPNKLQGILSMLVLAGLLLIPGSTLAQEGSIAGTARAADTNAPLSGATVRVPDLNRGVVTNDEGAFRLTGLSAGSYRVTATLIGYGRSVRNVTVTAGETTQVSFSLSPSAVQLGEIVVTGTGEAVEKKAVGNVIESVNVDEMEAASALSVSQILADRVPGLNTMVPTGASVASSSFRLRGAVSISQSNEPIIYVDGIRFNSKPDTIGDLPFTLTSIDNIDPSIIDRIEVIKGAAATTLYGTEASSGVIQIFTKKGYQGDPRVNMAVTQGLISIPKDRLEVPTVYSGGELLRSDARDAVLRTGHAQQYRASIRGGSEETSYYSSLGYDTQTGGQIGDALERFNGRLHLSQDFSDKLSGSVQAGYSYGDFDIPGSRKDPVGTLANAQLALPQAKSPDRPYGEIFVSIENAAQIERELRDQHFTAGGNISYDFSSEFSSDLTAGLEIRDTEARYHEPFGVNIEGSTDGEKRLDDSFGMSITLDLKTHWNHDISDDLNSSLTVGGQTFIDERQHNFVAVGGFPAKGITTISSASIVNGYGETQTEEVSAGAFAQERLSYKDRLFLTGGVRFDGHSSFGEEFGLQVYPKASVSYVISDEDFWNVPFWETLKLRGAFGMSGLAPGPFSAERSYVGDSYDGAPAAVPGNLGQPDLKPEVSREIELGFDGSLFNGRLGLTFTYFDQTTDDALVPRAFPPSQGFLQPQLVNAGTLESTGTETSLDLSVLETEDLGIDFSGSVSTVSTTVDLGGASPIRPGYQSYINYIISGFAPGSYFGEKLSPENPFDIIVDGELNPSDLSGFTSVDQVRINLLQNSAGGDSLAYLGKPDPDIYGNLGLTLRVADALTLDSRFSWEVGASAFNRTARIYSQLHLDERIARIQQELDDPNTSDARRRDLAAQYANLHTGAAENFVESGDHIRFEMLSLGYEFPQAFAASLFGADRLRASLTGRNLALWTGYSGTDPVTNEAGSTNFVRNTDFFQAPVPRRITLTLQATF